MEPLSQDEVAILLNIATPEQEERVEAVITDCLNIAAQHFGRSFSRPLVKYDVRGNYAGWAHGTEYIRLNPTLLAQHTEEYLRTTVPHEVAHIIQHQLYPRSKPHGKEWAYVMWVLGVPADRTHEWETKPARVHPRPWEYHCDCRTHWLTNRMHAKILNGQRRYCTKCRADLKRTA